MNAKKTLLTLAALAFAVTGCNDRSDSNKSEKPSTNPATSDTASTKPSVKPSTEPEPELPTELANADFDHAGGNDVTFDIDATFAMNMTYQAQKTNISFKKDSTLKLGDGLYREDYKVSATDGTDSETESGVAKYFKNANDFIGFTSAPDVHNQVKEDAVAQNWAFLKNPVAGDLDDSYFTYDAAASKGKDFSVFQVSEEAKVNSEATAKFRDLESYFTDNFVSMSDYVSQLGCSASDIKLDSVSLKVNLDGLIGFDMKYTFDVTDSTYGLAVNMASTLSVSVKDVDSTGLTLADCKDVPFVKTANADDKYTAFDTAVSQMKNIDAGGYKFSGVLKEITSKVGGMEGVIFKDGYSAKSYDCDLLGQPKKDSYSYSGVHKVKDGVYDYYTSETPAVAEGAAHVDIADVVPTFDFSTVIFEFDSKKSTAEDYVFTLRDAMDPATVLPLMTIYSFDNVTSVSVHVTSAGVFKGLDLSFTATSTVSNSTKTATYNLSLTFSDIGTVTSIPADLATFDGYVPYTEPTSYAEVKTAIIDYDKKEYYKGTTADVIKAVIGEDKFASVPDVFALTKMYSNYYGTIYSASQKFVEIQFAFKDQTSCASALKDLLAALKNAGHTMTQGTNKYVLKSTDISFEVAAGTDKSGNYLIAIDIAPVSNTATN